MRNVSRCIIGDDRYTIGASSGLLRCRYSGIVESWRVLQVLHLLGGAVGAAVYVQRASVGNGYRLLRGVLLALGYAHIWRA
ncbi:MAG: hypothetical protein IJO90_04605 [Alistipes sp.]|nr:hypothetical protein [Alistipes sp.]